MKIYIGPYINSIGVYQIADKIPFISEDTKDKIADWLSKTWISCFLTWIYEKRKRKVRIRIDRCDTWNMDHTLSLIILPMLKQLKNTKHGSPCVDDEDVPEHMRYSAPKDDSGFDMGDNWVHYKWDWVLNEMIWTFEQIVNQDDFDIFILDKEKYIEYNDRVSNGLRLFGKYYRNLWD